MMSHDVWLDYGYQEQEERQIPFEDFCKQQYEETFADKDDVDWPDYKEWLDEYYKSLEEEWKNEN